MKIKPPFANAMLYANEMTRRVAYNEIGLGAVLGRFSTKEKSKATKPT
jgi:hypothetical protein